MVNEMSTGERLFLIIINDMPRARVITLIKKVRLSKEKQQHDFANMVNEMSTGERLFLIIINDMPRARVGEIILQINAG